MITIKLTESQVDNLLDFFECDFIPSIQNNTYIDNMDYLVDMCEVYKMLKDSKKKGGDQNAR